MNRFPHAAFFLIGIFFLTNCSPSTGEALERAEAAAAASQSTGDLLDYLQYRSLRLRSVQPSATVRQLATSATSVQEVSFDEYPGILYIYEFSSEAEARQDASRVDFGSLRYVRQMPADFRGVSVPMSTIVEAPVFHRGRVIAAYMGDHVFVKSVLREALGQKFR